MSPEGYAPNGCSSNSPRSPLSPRLSGPPSPVTPRQQYANGSARMSGDFGATTEANGGLGNLADELADAWEEDENGYGYASGQEAAPSDSQPLEPIRTRTPSPTYSSGRDSLQPPRPKLRNGNNRHRRYESQYDGSDYGNDSDFEEVADISPALESQIAEVESLARRGLENNGSENDHVIDRAVTALQDLGAQSGIENNAMRYALVFFDMYMSRFEEPLLIIYLDSLPHTRRSHRTLLTKLAPSKTSPTLFFSLHSRSSLKKPSTLLSL